MMSHRSRPFASLLLGGALSLSLLLAAPSAAAKPKRGDNPFGHRLFPPQLVMRHQGAIKITDAQRKQFKQEMEALQKEVLPLKMEMEKAVEELRKTLASRKVDETKAIAIANKVMGIERKVKTRHLAMLIHIKNLLTPVQQNKLNKLRKRAD
jgi:Spy/CpxP family protein refolding chaperone